MKNVFFEKCSDCGSETLYVIVTEYGECASDIQFFCSQCKELVGGVINDPLNEVDPRDVEFNDYHSLRKTAKAEVS